MCRDEGDSYTYVFARIMYRFAYGPYKSRGPVRFWVRVPPPNASLAQLVEHRAVNAEVTGSIPV